MKAPLHVVVHPYYPFGKVFGGDHVEPEKYSQKIEELLASLNRIILCEEVQKIHETSTRIRATNSDIKLVPILTSESDSTGADPTPIEGWHALLGTIEDLRPGQIYVAGAVLCPLFRRRVWRQKWGGCVGVTYNTIKRRFPYTKLIHSACFTLSF